MSTLDSFHYVPYYMFYRYNGTYTSRLYYITYIQLKFNILICFFLKQLFYYTFTYFKIPEYHSWYFNIADRNRKFLTRPYLHLEHQSFLSNVFLVVLLIIVPSIFYYTTDDYFKTFTVGKQTGHLD